MRPQLKFGNNRTLIWVRTEGGGVGTEFPKMSGGTGWGQIFLLLRGEGVHEIFFMPLKSRF